MKARASWNGGRNGWASFIVGFGWMPGGGALQSRAERRQRVRSGDWGLHLYLGLWVVTIRGRAQR